MTFLLFGKQTSNRRTRPIRTDYVQRLVRLNNPKRQFLAVSFVTFPLKLEPVHHYRVIVLRVLDLVLLDAVDWPVLPQSVQRAAVSPEDCSGVHQVETLDALREEDFEAHQEEGFAGQRGGEDVLVLTLINFSLYLLFSFSILLSLF
jgi:hypothetical protein